ncbi:TetR family transcriptional regulator [Streptomyces sp. TS71-3]|uniref:TetR family transcriptional regulator n=1 Tax=Streptomyces sp. TS71-3 TaxID=2733862 RepID=UPI001B203EC2|nr:TetR family transcriptional regulator [Streptomyces sp. TS71-3]GHJ36185.1 transcriptional regulator [Streptomyces sp. TS71-3]
MSHTLGKRQAQKEQTRQALLDAALTLLADQSLSSLGLREVTRAAGIAPTAFYRHFHSTADLGIALVEQALGSLHEMIGITLAAPGGIDERIARSVDLIAGHVRRHPAHVRFVAREQHGGVSPVREAIARQLDQFSLEVRTELARRPESRGWDDDDLLMLARLYVNHMVMTAAAILEAPPEGLEAVTELARRQMRLMSLGRRHWLD